MLQENRIRPRESNEEEEDRNIRTNASNKLEIHRIMRTQHQTTPQLQIHVEGECDMRRSHYKKSINRVVDKQTHKRLN